MSHPDVDMHIRVDIDPSNPASFQASFLGKTWVSSSPDVAVYRLLTVYFPHMLTISPAAAELDGRLHSPDPPPFGPANP